MAKITMTPERFAEKQARNLKAALEDMRAGVEAVTESPGKQAAAKSDKMRARLLAALDSGKWKNNVGAVTAEDWKKAMIEKGLSRVPGGIDGAAEKVQEFARQLLDYQKGLKEKVDKMPDLTLEDSIARMTNWTRGMSSFRFKK